MSLINQVPGRMALLRRGLYVEYVSLAWMSIESAISILAGLNAGSLALLAFGGDSLIELISAYAVACSIRKLLTSNKDFSSQDWHPRRIELISTLLLVSLIPTIGLGSVYSYIAGVESKPSLVGIAVAFCAAFIMPSLWAGKRKFGRDADFHPLSIDAIESATCFWMSVALLGGLLVNQYARISWGDYVATAIILAFVLKEAVRSFVTLRGESTSE